LATTARSRLGIVLLFGRGDGTFEPAPGIEAPPADYVGAADLNEDEHVDLVGAGDELAVLLGNGDGTFAPPLQYAAGSALHGGGEQPLLWLDVADLDSDTTLDLVAVNWVASQLAVLLGNGDGTFNPALLYPCRVCDAVEVADLDRDGNVDVVTTSFAPGVAGRLYVFLNNGGGRLSEPIAYDLRGSPVAIALGDLNGDGALDVITGNGGTNPNYSVSVLLGKGDGTFREVQTYRAGNETSAVAVVDLDGDGKLDVLAGSYLDTKVWFYRGTGDGRLIETQGIEAAPDVARSLVTADFDGDGKLDLALTYAGTRAVVSILLGK